MNYHKSRPVNSGVCMYLLLGKAKVAIRKGIILIILYAHRVPEFLSSRLNWVPPPSPPASECESLPLGSWGGHTLLRWSG